MKVGLENAERYLGEWAPIGADLEAICARINRVFGVQHNGDGTHQPLPVCVATSNAQQAVATGTFTNVQFDTNVVDTHDLHNTSTRNHVFTIAEPGLYLLLATVFYASNATGRRLARWITEEGENVGAGDVQTASGSFQTSAVAWAIWRCATNTRLIVQAYQDSGGSLNIGDTTGYTRNHAAVIRIPWAV